MQLRKYVFFLDDFTIARQDLEVVQRNKTFLYTQDGRNRYITRDMLDQVITNSDGILKYHTLDTEEDQVRNLLIDFAKRYCLKTIEYHKQQIQNLEKLLLKEDIALDTLSVNY